MRSAALFCLLAARIKAMQVIQDRQPLPSPLASPLGLPHGRTSAHMLASSPMDSSRVDLTPAI